MTAFGETNTGVCCTKLQFLGKGPSKTSASQIKYWGNKSDSTLEI